MSGRGTARTLDCGCRGDYRNGAVVCLPCPSHPVPYWSVAQLVRMFAPEEVRNAPLLPL